MAFALFCVLNVMTGVFVENASKMTSADEAGLGYRTSHGTTQELDTNHNHGMNLWGQGQLDVLTYQ